MRMMRFSLTTVLVGVAITAMVVHLRFEIWGFPSVNWEPYTPEAVEETLAEDKIAVVLLRSKYTVWGMEFIDTKLLRRVYWNRKVEFFDLVWKWEKSDRLELPFFEEFGFTKGPLIVVMEAGEPNVAFDGYERKKIENEIRARLSLIAPRSKHSGDDLEPRRIIPRISTEH